MFVTVQFKFLTSGTRPSLKYFQLPDCKEGLNCTMLLVKSGSWLLLDDFIAVFQDDSGLGPRQEAFWKFWTQYLVNKNMGPYAAPAFQGVIESFRLFSEVNVREVVVPIAKRDDPRIGELDLVHASMFDRSNECVPLTHRESVALPGRTDGPSVSGCTFKRMMLVKII